MRTRRKKRDYTHRNRYEEEFLNIMHHVLIQFHLKEGLRRFGKDGVTAVKTELRQLHDKLTFDPIHKSSLTRGQRKKALRALMFLKEKRSGDIKGLNVVDGRKQRETAKKGEATSPTVYTKSVIITAVIDAIKNRDVAIADVPGAFLTVDLNE